MCYKLILEIILNLNILQNNYQTNLQGTTED